LARNHAAFDVQHDFLSIFGIFGEVFIEEVTGIALRSTIEFASIP
jgi:hypothetical protein